MSRMGVKPINVPDGVKVEIRGDDIVVTGAKGKLTNNIPEGIETEFVSEKIYVKRTSEDRKYKALHGLTRSIIANMIEGVTKGFSKHLEIVGIGYKAELLGKDTLKFSLGYSMDIEFKIPQSISAVVEERGTRLSLEGIDKQVVGEIAARIRRLRPPDSYKGKGIRYRDEILRLKPGKAGVKAA